MSQSTPGLASILAVAALLGPCCLPATAFAGALFESDETLAIVLELPVNDLLKHAKKKPTVDAKLRYLDGDTEIVIPVTVTTRGKSRLEQCRYPPLSINLKKKQAASTVFEGIKRLKLVTPCRGTAVYQRYLDQEYAVYRAFNLLTDYSFRVRKLAVTFRDSNGRHKDATHAAFFIEPTKSAAARLEMGIIKSPRIEASQLEPEQISIMALFQFLIGNTDWSVRKGPGTEDCCHNGKVVGPRESKDGWVVLPYDFDQSGIINTSYAAPAKELRIRSVRQRVYRGFCRGNSQLTETIALFNKHRAGLEALFGGASSNKGANKSALVYVKSFYEIINDPGKRKKNILDECRSINEKQENGNSRRQDTDR